MKLENLKAAFETQFSTIYQTKHSSCNYDLEELAVSVNIVMNRIAIPETPIPAGVAHCGGGKQCDDIVLITVTPPNEKVEKLASEFFLNRETPGWGMAPPSKTFAKVVINGIIARSREVGEKLG
jgi:hypothetical protein